MSAVLRIARITSSYVNFTNKINALLTRMENQGGNRRKLVQQIFKAFDNHRLVFAKYNICSTDISRTFQWYFSKGNNSTLNYFFSAGGLKLSNFCLWEVTLPLITLVNWLFLSRGVEMIEFLSLGSNAPTYNLS